MIQINKRKVIKVGIFLAFFCLVFFSGIIIGKQSVVCQVCKPETVNFSLFWDAYNKLRQHYINPETIDEQKIMYGAISGMAASLDDPYTSFFDPEQAKIFEQDLAGSFGGVGIEVGIKKDQLTVVAPIKGTPSQKAGLKAGDIIVKINGKSTVDMDTDQAVRLIRGKEGTKVTLTIFREGWKDIKDITIVRDTINIPSIEWEIKNNDVAYIHIYQFDEKLSSNFRKVAFEILDSPAKKIVLDLRNNPGGYLQVAQEIAGWFLEKGQIVTIEDFGTTKEKQEYKTEGNAGLAAYPIVVLINKGSASASEILAGALRDNRNVKLVGEKSFGKGSVQEVIRLQDGISFLKITIAKWLTPKGSSISEVGLTPDIVVNMPEGDSETDKDPQLDKALEII